jgi:predicted lipid-binding transport protein (Tim44 family)
VPKNHEFGNQKMSRRLSLTAILLTLTFVALTGCGQDKNAETIDTGSSTSVIENGAGGSRSGSAQSDKAAKESESAENSGTDAQKSTPSAPSAPSASSDTSSSPATSNPSQNPFEVAGIQDPKAFLNTFKALQKAVADNDKEKVANYILYPLRVNDSEKSLTIPNKKDFMAKYDQIFTDAIREALVNQKTDDLFVNYQGVMVGSGELWLRRATDNPKLFGVFSINLETVAN